MIKSAMRFLSCLVALVAVGYLPPANAFDFDTGKAPLDVVVPTVLPIIFSDISPTASDPTLVLRFTTMLSNSWFDAIAPYHPAAVGALSNLGRRPPSESVTNRNKNIAILYASYRVLNSLLPQRNAEWRAMLTSVGLNPDNTSEDRATPAGIGNLAGKAIVAFKLHDGMNQLGNIECKYNCKPYADYTGYEPVNSAYELRFPGRWQPAITTTEHGIFKVQQFVTPQYAFTKAYTYDSPDQFVVPPPSKSDPRNFTAYKQQADEVLAASANLTDYQKMVAERFNDKLLSLGFAEQFTASSHNFNLDQTVQLIFQNNMAVWDAGIAIWRLKRIYDAVRPFSAIHHLYGDTVVTAWGGPGKGTVDNLPGSQWTSYLPVADHPEYPSGTACLCSAHAQASRRFVGSDTFGWSIAVAKGSSLIEPGATPATDIVLGPWETYTKFEHECGTSRFWGGVHFQDSIKASQALCPVFGDMAYNYVHRHILGQR